MDERLLAAYRATEYRVRLKGGGWAAIRIDAPLPVALQAFAGTHPWAFITAWNPRSQASSRVQNRIAQRRLLADLRGETGLFCLRAGVGASEAGDWREPSLFVIGLPMETLDRLAQRYGQHAYVHGQGPAPAQLRWTSPD